MLERPRPWWVLASLLPFGWLTCAGLLYAGVRARMRSLQLLAVLFLATDVAGFAIPGTTGGFVIIISWIAGITVSVAAAPPWQRRLRSGRLEAERRLTSRREALALSRENPELAREVGIGRPDVPQAEHAGVVDVNSAPAAVLARLPGIDDALAAEIVRAREEVDGFASLADMGTVLRLPGDVVEDLRERVVFLPR